MHHLRLITFILVLLSVGDSNGQSFDSKAETAISSYFFIAQDQVYLNLGISAETNTAIMFQKDDEEARSFMTTSLNIVLDSLNEKTDLTILPANTLEGKVTYSRTGFPLSSLKKAAKKSDQAQYVKIDINVLGTKTRSRSSTISQNLTDDDNDVGVQVDDADLALSQTTSTSQYYPKVEVTLKFGDSEGKTALKITGEYIHDELVSVSTESTDVSLVGRNSLMGITIMNSEGGTEIPFYAFLALAVEDLIQQLPKE